MENEKWESPRKIEADRRALRLKVGNALCDVILDGLMKPSEALKVYRNQFPEVAKEDE